MFFKNFTLYFFYHKLHKFSQIILFTLAKRFAGICGIRGYIFFYNFFVTNDLILNTASGINFPVSGKSVKSGVSGSVSAFGV